MEDKLVTLATEHYTAAEILKARLEDAGIQCELKHVHLIQGAASEGVKIMIRTSDVERALRLMYQWKEAQETARDKNPRAIRRVLVAVDFSSYSRSACLYAMNLADKLGADVKILHVYYAPIVDLVPITDAYSIQVDMDINLREHEEKSRKNLLSFVQDIRAEASRLGLEKVKTGYTLREGIVEDEISRVAREDKPGIIVLGTKGKGEKQSDIIGSVVHRLLDRTRVPVLAIPEQSRFDPSRQVKQIAYATHFDDSDYVAIRRLLSIVSDFKAHVHCIHLSREGHKSWDAVRMDRLKDYFRKISKEVEVTCHLLEGPDEMKELEQFVEMEEIDLISMVSRKRSLLSRLFDKGLTRKLIHQSTTPLLFFRA